MERALVTGGAGFIGSYLCEKLVNDGYHISIIDNLFRGKRENISHLLNKNNIFYNLDMVAENAVENISNILAVEKPRYIFHYAAINGTQYFYDMPSQVLETNLMATYNLMKAIRIVKQKIPNYVTKIIYASSSEVYGEPFSLPSRETDLTYVNIEHIRDSYATAKLSGEFFVKIIAEEIGIDWLTLRLFNVYGPRMVGTKYGQVIPEFITRIGHGEHPLKIYGNGEHKRSFCYVTDNVSNTVKLAVSDAVEGVYNVGNSTEVSISELGDIIMRKLGYQPLFEFLPEREGDHKRRCPNTEKLHSVIGKSKYIELDKGIDMMLEEY